MARYFDTVAGVLRRHGGEVEKFIGDAVMTVFGIPAAHEDDALRAARAAADLREALAALNDELERSWGAQLAVRMGVNTGEVVAGDASSGQALVTGDAVNVAARLEQAAAPGEILLGEGTYRLVRDAARCEPVGPLELKGKTSSVQAYRLLEVVAGAPGLSRRLDSPLVGRESELALVRQACERARRERTSHLFTILGSAGIGKTRLANEFASAVAVEARVLAGRCLPYGEGITFWPIAEIVREAAGEDTRVGIARLLEAEKDGGLVAERISGLLGLAGAAAGPGEETFWAVRRLVEAIARERPLVLILEDVHWAEPTLLDLVEYLADWIRDAPVLLLCLARPEFLDERPGWAGGKLNATSILLEPLSEAESGRLLGNLLPEADLPVRARERIEAAAQGNPLFLEQLLAMLIENGLLRRDDGRWVAAAELAELSAPPAIQALLAARLDRLGAEERLLIEAASVEGEAFHMGGLRELLPQEFHARLGANLRALVRKELVRPDRAAIAGGEAFRFRHILVRDAAYQSLPKGTRAELHERFASWLERASGDAAGELEEILGYHLEQAYRSREALGPIDEDGRELARKAADRLARAGKRALGRSDMPAAANLLGRAVELLPTAARERLELVPELGRALISVGELARADALLGETVDIAAAAGESRVELRAALERAYLRTNIDPEGRIEESAHVAERAIPVFERVGDELGLARALWVLAEATNARCRYRVGPRLHPHARR